MKMNFQKLIVLCCFFSYGRDPFYYADGHHMLVCTSLGGIHNRCIVAQILLDGVMYQVKEGDTIGDYTVVALSMHGVSLQEGDGTIRVLELSSKKGPFNLGKLKG